jgi:CrcB protein
LDADHPQRGSFLHADSHSFSLQTLNLMNDGEWIYAAGNAGLSFVLCLIAVWAGHVLAINLNVMRWV